jgi:hypothetical protein
MSEAFTTLGCSINWSHTCDKARATGFASPASPPIAQFTPVGMIKAAVNLPEQRRDA